MTLWLVGSWTVVNADTEEEAHHQWPPETLPAPMAVEVEVAAAQLADLLEEHELMRRGGYLP